MTTLSETIATHIDTNWDIDSGNNPKPTIASKYDHPLPSAIETDNVIVLPDEHSVYQNLSSGYRLKTITITIQIVAKSKVGDATNRQERLERLLNEVEHVCNKKNHVITGGYYEHYLDMDMNRSKVMGASVAEGLAKIDVTLVLKDVEAR